MRKERQKKEIGRSHQNSNEPDDNEDDKQTPMPMRRRRPHRMNNRDIPRRDDQQTDELECSHTFPR